MGTPPTKQQAVLASLLSGLFGGFGGSEQKRAAQAARQAHPRASGLASALGSMALGTGASAAAGAGLARQIAAGAGSAAGEAIGHGAGAEGAALAGGVAGGAEIGMHAIPKIGPALAALPMPIKFGKDVPGVEKKAIGDVLDRYLQAGEDLDVDLVTGDAARREMDLIYPSGRYSGVYEPQYNRILAPLDEGAHRDAHVLAHELAHAMDVRTRSGFDEADEELVGGVMAGPDSIPLRSWLPPGFDRGRTSSPHRYAEPGAPPQRSTPLGQELFADTHATLALARALGWYPPHAPGFDDSVFNLGLYVPLSPPWSPNKGVSEKELVDLLAGNLRRNKATHAEWLESSEPMVEHPDASEYAPLKFAPVIRPYSGRQRRPLPEGWERFQGPHRHRMTSLEAQNIWKWLPLKTHKFPRATEDSYFDVDPYSLTPEQAWDYYKHRGGTFNRALRRDELPRGLVESMESYMEDLPDDLTLFRGDNNVPMEWNFWPPEPGTILEEPAFTSTSVWSGTARDFAPGGNPLLRIHGASKGIRGVGHEQEVVLPSDSKFQVIGSEPIVGPEKGGFGGHSGRLIDVLALPPRQVSAPMPIMRRPGPESMRVYHGTGATFDPVQIRGGGRGVWFGDQGVAAGYVGGNPAMGKRDAHGVPKPRRLLEARPRMMPDERSMPYAMDDIEWIREVNPETMQPVPGLFGQKRKPLPEGWERYSLHGSWPIDPPNPQKFADLLRDDPVPVAYGMPGHDLWQRYYDRPSQFNRVYRDAGGPANLAEHETMLDTMMDLPDDLALYRGVEHHVPPEWYREPPPIGHTIHEPGFSSTSTDAGVAAAFAGDSPLLRIFGAKRGKPMPFGEEEVVLPPGGTFRVIGAPEVPGGRIGPWGVGPRLIDVLVQPP